MTPFPWKPCAAILADWALTSIDAAHAPVMERANALIETGVPAAVKFAISVVPSSGFFARLTEGIEDADIEQVGSNVLARWVPFADDAWVNALTAARSSAQALLGPIPTSAATAATAPD